MILKLGGPFNRYNNGQVIELDDVAGQALVDDLGGVESGRIEILGDLRSPVDQVQNQPGTSVPQTRAEQRAAAEEAALLEAIANEEAAAALTAAASLTSD